MRVAYLLLIACVLPSIGCTMLVVNSGKVLTALKSQAKVHEAFGLPTATGQAEGMPYEDFITRRKIAEPQKNIYLIMGTIWTCGFGEFVWFPTELYRAVRRSVVGQSLRFTYDAAGNVTAIRFDNDPVLLPPRIETPSAEK